MSKIPQSLKQKREEVISLFNYIKQQSDKTQIELEEDLFLKIFGSNVEIKAPGKQWSRWANGYIVPTLDTIKILFNYAVDNLINGIWIENGHETEWRELLPAVTDKEFAFLLNHHKALSITYNALEAPGVITNEKRRAIEMGYYLPSKQDIEKLFFTTIPRTKSEIFGFERHYISCKDEIEHLAVQTMLHEIETRFGVNQDDKIALSSFKKKMKLVDDFNTDWFDLLISKLQKDFEILTEIADRLCLLDGGYPIDLEEVMIGKEILLSANKLRKRLNEISTMTFNQRTSLKNDIFLFNVRAQNLDESKSTKYLSTIEAMEYDYAGRSLRQMNPVMFGQIL